MVSRKSPLPSMPVSAATEDRPVPFADKRPLERTVIDLLQSHPGLNVCSLVVHRCPEGLCVEGHVVLIDPDVNLAQLLAEIDTTTPILNRVLISATSIDAV